MFLLKTQFSLPFRKEKSIKQFLKRSTGSFGSDHPRVAKSLGGLGSLYSLWGIYDEGESYFKKSVKIYEKVFEFPRKF